MSSSAATERGFRRYALAALVLTAAGLAAVAAVNGVADPFTVYAAVSPSMFAPYRTYRYRVPKAERLLSREWETVILGSSRSEVGIRTDHPAWGSPAVFNGSLSATNYYEMARMLQLALRSAAVKRVVLFADPDHFGLPLGPNTDYMDSKLNPSLDLVQYHLWNLIGMRATLEAGKTLVRAARGERSPVTPEGTARPWPKPVDHRRAIAASLARLFSAGVDPAEYARRMPEALELFRDMVRRCHERGIELIVVLPPVHVIDTEARRLAGLWPLLEETKREMVAIVREEAEAKGAEPFPLWDFNRYSAYTTEEIPAAGETARPMRWFYENTHFTQALGDRVIERILGGEPPERDGDWAVLLTPDNVESQLAENRRSREAYAASHGAEVEFIRRTAASVGWEPQEHSKP